MTVEETTKPRFDDDEARTKVIVSAQVGFNPYRYMVTDAPQRPLRDLTSTILGRASAFVRTQPGGDPARHLPMTCRFLLFN
jgi:hypothetical protein